jgi:hypothetical protein
MISVAYNNLKVSIGRFNVSGAIGHLCKGIEPFHLLILTSYLLFSFVFYIYVAEPALIGETDFRVWADADLYEVTADLYEGVSDLIGIDTNRFGPVMIVSLLNNNYFYIYLFNCLILLVSFYLINSTGDINGSKLLFYLLINPMLFISLMSVNKEILSLLFAALLLSYLKNHQTKYLLLCLLVSFFVRWQLTIFLLIYLLLISPFLKMNTNRFKALSCLLIIISAVYIMAAEQFDTVMDAAILYTDIDASGSGLVMRLNDLQLKYGYFLVFIPKIFQNLFGSIMRISAIFDWSDFYNNFIVATQSILFAVMAILLIVKKKLNIYNDIFYLAIIYSILFALSPFVQNRYFFVVYVVLAVLLANKNEDEASCNERTAS